MAPMPPPPSSSERAAAAAAAAEPSVPPLRVPIRFQCPLCLDVLRRPVLLPCCHRHLCTSCFERALELTSVNCGFCRRRIVGFARTKQNKVDEALWRAIRVLCPFAADAADDAGPPVEFVDEDAPPLHAQGEDHPTRAGDARPGELRALYEQQLRAREAQRQEEERRALRQTLAFLETDAEFQAATASAQTPTLTPAQSAIHARRRPRADRGGPPAHHRPLTRSVSHVDSRQKQQRLDVFLAPSSVVTRSMTPDPTSGDDRSGGEDEDEDDGEHEEGGGRGGGGEGEEADGDSERLLKPRRRRRRRGDPAADVSPRTRILTRSAEQEAMLITRHNHYPRSSSLSPERRAPRVTRPLLQTTLVAAARGHNHNHNHSHSHSHSHSHTRGRAATDSADGSVTSGKRLTRQGSRRAWKCPRCTFGNTCFDSRCSMCHSVPPTSAYAPL